MINLTQVILVVVITTLTILLTFIGIQVVYILKDFRETIKRLNKVIDHAEAISAAVVRPITGISSLVEGIQSSVKIAELLGFVKKQAKHIANELPEKAHEIKQNIIQAKDGLEERLDDLKGETETDRPPAAPKIQVPKFFHRSGTPLG